jgi:filamentous hemagglutinin family protein
MDVPVAPLRARPARVLPALRLRTTLALALAAGLAFGGECALAGPEGENVVKGTALFRRDAGLTTITTGRTAIINFRSFDIAPNETVRFIQPDAASRVLNRIQGPAPTRIDGTLLANGRVYLVNRAGVVFGKNSVVNVESLHAVAGELSNADFMRGMDRFTNVTGGITSEGLIEARSVMLVGSMIENHGRIVADGGIVTLASGRAISRL